MNEQTPRPRRRQRPSIDHSVPSPCVAICRYDQNDRYCVGCLRSSDEIREWMIMSKEQKLEVLEKISQRRAEQPQQPDSH